MFLLHGRLNNRWVLDIILGQFVESPGTLRFPGSLAYSVEGICLHAGRTRACTAKSAMGFKFMQVGRGGRTVATLSFEIFPFILCLTLVSLSLSRSRNGFLAAASAARGIILLLLFPAFLRDLLSLPLSSGYESNVPTVLPSCCSEKEGEEEGVKAEEEDAERGAWGRDE